jgi:hypothetical protein
MSKNVLCMTKDSNNIMKLCQIHGVPTSWLYKHNYKIWIIISLNNKWFFSKYCNYGFNSLQQFFWFLLLWLHLYLIKIPIVT